MKTRTLFGGSALLLVVLGSAAAASLVATTSELRRGSDVLTTTVASVHAAGQLEIALLIHARERRLLEVTEDRAHRASMNAWARSIQIALEDVTRDLGSDEERALVELLESRTGEYLALLEDSNWSDAEVRRRFEEVLAAAERLVDLNVRQATSMQLRARSVDQLANVVGIASAGGLLLGLLGVLLLMRAQLYWPLLRLREALCRYKIGEKEHRLPEHGAEEVREIALEFNEMATTLASNERAQIAFLAGVAHDLRSPLNTLKLVAAAVTRASALPPEPNIRQTFARISDQVDRINRMVDDLLDRTRIEAGDLELRFEERDLGAIMSEVVQHQVPAAPDHRLQLELPTTPLLVRCDPLRMEQVLTNLISNAVKYSPGGGTVKIVARRCGHEVLTSVSDEGLGIPAHEHETIFQPFKRSGSTRNQIPGVGLGLSVTRRIVTAHGGTIEVDSAPGKGSTFSIRLPLSAQQGRVDQFSGWVQELSPD